jgi:uncharacterized membrane protein
MKKKKRLIIVFIVTLVLISILWFLKSKKEEPQTPKIQKGALTLIQTIPPEGEKESLFTSTAILFSFDSPLVLSTAQVTIDPQIEISLETARNSSSTLAIRPLGEWQEGTLYTITIKKGLMSVNNKELKEDLVYKIKFKFPEDIPHY